MQKYIESLYIKKPKQTATKKRQAQPEANISKYDILKKRHKFLRQSDSEDSSDDESDSQQKKQKVQKPPQRTSKPAKKEQKQQKLAKEYYDSLYKEYAIVDLSKYQTGQIGCRWRTAKEVIKNKGEKICGALKCNEESTNVYEMNFGYFQEGAKKNALVKVSVCKDCGVKLNHSKKFRQIISKVKIEE